MTFDDLKSLMVLTLRDPTQAARMLIAANPPLSTRWMALVLAVTLSSILAWMASQVMPMPSSGQRSPIGAMVSQPFVMAGMQFIALSMAAALMASVGRMFGGYGRFEDALLLTVWIEIVLMVVQALQVVLLLLLPGLSSILGFVAIALFFWLTIRFVKELHGFRSGAKVMLVMLLTMVVAGFVLSFIAAAFGLLPEVPQ